MKTEDDENPVDITGIASNVAMAMETNIARFPWNEKN